MYRKRLCFSKKGNLKFIGHLDFLRVFGEMISRSRLPVSYSAGFNPHILLSFALPLPLGFESENDYADLVFDVDLPFEEISASLNDVAPKGLIIKTVYDAKDKCASVIAMADYSVKLNDGNTEAIEHALSQESIVIPKKTKSGLKNTDIRQDIISVASKNGEVRMRLSAGSARFLHPVTVAEVIFGYKPSPIGFTRLEMYKMEKLETRDEKQEVLSYSLVPVKL